MEEKERHKKVAYREVDLGTQDGFQVREGDDGRGRIVEGECPRCDVTVRFGISFGSPGGRGMEKRTSRGLEEAPRIATATIYCTCGYDHERPKEATDNGCGAYWQVRI